MKLISLIHSSEFNHLFFFIRSKLLINFISFKLMRYITKTSLTLLLSEKIHYNFTLKIFCLDLNHEHHEATSRYLNIMYNKKYNFHYFKDRMYSMIRCAVTLVSCFLFNWLIGYLIKSQYNDTFHTDFESREHYNFIMNCTSYKALKSFFQIFWRLQPFWLNQQCYCNFIVLLMICDLSF